jgi:hypothetical protein
VKPARKQNSEFKMKQVSVSFLYKKKPVGRKYSDEQLLFES